MLTVGSKAGYQTTHSGYIIYIYTPVGKWTLNIDDLSVLLKYIVRSYFYKLSILLLKYDFGVYFTTPI